jgi:hypothetical protein
MTSDPVNRQLGADDRAQARLLRRLVETGRAIHAVGIDLGERRVAERRGTLDERFRQRCALQKAEGRRGVKFYVQDKTVGATCCRSSVR